mmetsp:Transcript_65429/g.122026  ORF Transcript_65429/g.122026 Transcript_65429/m.122026 type:complete len:82 (+) Transcript_65429:330-575(+)
MTAQGSKVADTESAKESTVWFRSDMGFLANDLHAHRAAPARIEKARTYNPWRIPSMTTMSMLVLALVYDRRSRHFGASSAG